MADRVLVVDDREGIRTFIAEALTAAGYEVTTAPDGRDAAALISRTDFELMFTDLKMPGMDGIALMEKARTVAPDMAVIVLTAHGTVETAVQAMKLGAFDYLTKPLGSPDELRLIAARAAEHQRMRRRAVNGDVSRTMIAEDPVSLAVMTMIRKVAVTDATVLLLGESGVGKEVAAEEIHRLSPRRDNPFVAVNCAAISETLVESEMFGHEKGAFTGAGDRRIGRFERANRGTLFLDEVGELPLSLQAKLLRVLQERRFERVGGTEPIEVDVRVVAATNRDLATEIAKGGFREDLYHRLAVFPIEIPALRSRRRDIAPLTAHLLDNISRRLNKPRIEANAEAMAAIGRHDWPGNIRELGNVLERAAILTESGTIEPEHLLLKRSGPPKDALSDAGRGGASLRDIEREAIRQALAATDGHRKKAAERLGISLRTLYNKLKEYEIE